MKHFRYAGLLGYLFSGFFKGVILTSLFFGVRVSDRRTLWLLLVEVAQAPELLALAVG